MTPTRTRIWRRRRGSALIYVSIMMVAIATVVVSSVSVNVAAVKKAERRLEDAKAQATFDAQVALVDTLCKSNSITLPYTFSTTLNGRGMDCTVTNNHSSIARTYLVSSTMPSDSTRSFKRVIGGRQKTSPLYYALYTNGDCDYSSNVLTTSGPVYAGGNVTLGAGSTIGGDLYAGGTIDSGTSTVTGNAVPAMPAPTFPSVTRNDYKDNSNLVVELLNLLNLILGTSLLSGHYGIYYYDTTQNFRGMLTGKGAVYFKKDIQVIGDVTYSVSSSHVVFICEGDLTINGGVNNLDGTWYVKGRLISNGGTSTLNVGRGNIIAQGGMSGFTRPLSITADTNVWDDRSQGFMYCVPGFWPATDANLTR